jgi:hypothetical protein
VCDFYPCIRDTRTNVHPHSTSPFSSSLTSALSLVADPVLLHRIQASFPWNLSLLCSLLIRHSTLSSYRHPPIITFAPLFCFLLLLLISTRQQCDLASFHALTRQPQNSSNTPSWNETGLLSLRQLSSWHSTTFRRQVRQAVDLPKSTTSHTVEVDVGTERFLEEVPKEHRVSHILLFMFFYALLRCSCLPSSEPYSGLSMFCVRLLSPA